MNIALNHDLQHFLFQFLAYTPACSACLLISEIRQTQVTPIITVILPRFLIALFEVLENLDYLDLSLSDCSNVQIKITFLFQDLR